MSMIILRRRQHGEHAGTTTDGKPGGARPERARLGHSNVRCRVIIGYLLPSLTLPAMLHPGTGALRGQCRDTSVSLWECRYIPANKMASRPVPV